MTADALIHEVTSSPVAADIRRALNARWSGGGEPLDEISRYALLSPGKLLRPLMLVASAEAVGGDREAVMPAALAVEYLHAATLVHDDIIDGDDTRRGRASVHARYGVADAIITGDALIIRLFGSLAECPVPEADVLSAVRILARAGEDLCRGQMQEALLVPPAAGAPGSGLAAYLGMAALKTGALFRGACQAGAVLGGGTPGEVAVVAEFAEHTGLAFQMYDDLLPFLGDPAVTGKPDTSDVSNLRPTFPVLLAHREGGPAERRRIERVLAGGLGPGAALAAMREVVVATGALDLALAHAQEEVRLARSGLGALRSAEAAGLLGAVAELAVRRDR
ncbi:polyprenyl synthetase family protein [Saccharopolyspora erythraea]|uniref:polyprenyl synthetase family protein n=1 Tax=Saccharopolyspora erythraea TaxID=1836 RepID=UPI001BA99377|nr:polyprenyl synthetase family protein [Saccharopolyspora erythraea]QUH03716.1 polyprenyl synthetase family protein [Saccharopolyspora erythraea]